MLECLLGRCHSSFKLKISSRQRQIDLCVKLRVEIKFACVRKNTTKMAI